MARNLSRKLWPCFLMVATPQYHGVCRLQLSLCVTTIKKYKPNLHLDGYNLKRSI